MKFFRKTGWKLLLDTIMAVLLALMYSKRVFGMEFHEIGGMALCGLFIIHKLLNFKWIKAITAGLFRGKTPLRQKLFWVLDLLLLSSFAFILVSGILISTVVFPNLFGNANGSLKVWHYGVSAFALALSGIHLGLHMGWIRRQMGFLGKIPTVLRKSLAVVLSVAVLAFGTYSVTSTSFLNWIGNLGNGFASGVPAQMTPDQSLLPQMENSEDTPDFSVSQSGEETTPIRGGDGTGLRDGQGPHGSGEGGGVADASVVTVLASFLSILFGFAVLTAWINGGGLALKRKRLRKTAIAG